MAKECKENEIEREFVRQMEVWSKTGDHPQMAGLGAILGGMALAIVLFTALVWKAGASLPMLFATITARMQLPGPIKKYEPKFSYEFF